MLKLYPDYPSTRMLARAAEDPAACSLIRGLTGFFPQSTQVAIESIDAGPRELL